ncbi:MAG: phospho-N-acetylmuramoyl-pentapeptide-transferase [Bacteroidia bacterium]
MLYYLFTYLDAEYGIPGAGLFQFISFRTAMAVMLSLIITMLFGKQIIALLQRQQVKESVRNLGLEGQIEKQGTPTMGGLIILSAILFPVLFFAKLGNIYILIMLIATVWLGAIGFLDDYIKVFKKDKRGLAGKFKIMGQVSIGIIVGALIYFHPDIVIRESMSSHKLEQLDPGYGDIYNVQENTTAQDTGQLYNVDLHSTKTTIPFFKENEFDYAIILESISSDYREYTWILYILIVIFIITAVSNGVNMADGLDGLASGLSAIVFAVLALFAYVSGNTIFADYLNIMYIPNLGELVIFSGALVGACVGFLWFNAFPAKVFMGDTGSLALGGLIAVLALLVRKELLIPLLCGLFLIENVSVILQVAYFKYTKRKYGEGRRIFKMAPLHHHYQKLGFHESKIVTRFWIVGVFLGLLTIITLKIR